MAFAGHRHRMSSQQDLANCCLMFKCLERWLNSVVFPGKSFNHPWRELLSRSSDNLDGCRSSSSPDPCRHRPPPSVLLPAPGWKSSSHAGLSTPPLPLPLETSQIPTPGPRARAAWKPGLCSSRLDLQVWGSHSWLRWKAPTALTSDSGNRRWVQPACRMGRKAQWPPQSSRERGVFQVPFCCCPRGPLLETARYKGPSPA